mgnify:FL=1
MSAGLDLAPVPEDGVRIDAELREGGLRITMTGAVEMRDPGAVLNPFWESVDASVSRLGIARTEVDLSGVSFMNSSGLMTLVRWITRPHEAGENAGCRVTLRYDEGVTWQRTNVPILARPSPAFVALERID